MYMCNVSNETETAVDGDSRIQPRELVHVHVATNQEYP